MKKGFTLVEIIISIAIIVVIGTGATFFVINSNKNKEVDILVANEDNFYNALEVYLSTNSYVVENVYKNAEGAVISLEVLKNEGLISDDLKIDYEDNYYVVSNAFLGNKDLGENVVEEECNNSIGLTKIASWASNNDTTDVLYFCPKDDGGGIDKVNELLCSDIPYPKETLEYNIICNAKKVNERWQTSYRETPYTKAGEVVAGYEQILTKTEDDYGTSYYYKGNVVDNYVNFAGMCWRIVRVQGDGSVKLILDGKNGLCNSNNYTQASSVGISYYGAKQAILVDVSVRSNYLYWYYHKYKSNVLLELVAPEVMIFNEDTYEDASLNISYPFYTDTPWHWNGTLIDASYINNFSIDKEKETPVYAISYLYNFQKSISSYEDYLKLDGWCVENNFYHDQYAPSGISAEKLWNDHWTPEFGNLYQRNLYTSTYLNYKNKTPTLKCSENKTMKYANNENMYVGMATIDEVLYSGGVYENRDKEYGISYMFPSVGSSAQFFVLNKYDTSTAMVASSATYLDGGINSGTNTFLPHEEWISGNLTLNTANENSFSPEKGNVRPVIVLKSGLKSSGDGTIDNPYVIS